MEDKLYVVVSFSGGRTSAFMAIWLNSNKQTVADYFDVPVSDLEFIFIFANTGREEEDTLRFVRDVSEKHLTDQVVWLEAVVHHGKRKSCTHRIVNFDSAFRKDEYLKPGHPFAEYVKKYGVPNVKFRSCTRELKLRPIESYLKSLGLSKDMYWTAIGIREDETRRVSPTAVDQEIFYPLVDLVPMDKQDVLDFWETYPHDLQIPEWRGNCITCFKKSFKKLMKVWQESPEDFEFCQHIEQEYGFVGPEFKKYGVTKPRKHFRESRNTEEIIALFRELNNDGVNPAEYIDTNRDAGCSESCEMYEME